MRMKKTIISILVAVCLMLVPLNSFADSFDPIIEDYVQEVSTESEIKDVITNLNTDGESKAIKLTSDISDVGTLSLSNGTLTIYGDGHTITFKNGVDKGGIRVSGNNGAKLNLGSEGNSGGTLTLTRATANDTPGVISLEGDAVVNMYDGTSIVDSKNSNYFGGAVTIGGTTTVANTAVFNMYGGLIDNCGIDGGTACAGGGVSVMSGGTFNMYGGKISNCYATAAQVDNVYVKQFILGAGGGVYVGYGSSFNMTGGTIENCTASDFGGGIGSVSVYNYGSGYFNNSIKIDGGTITGCSAGDGYGNYDGLGGGIGIAGYVIYASTICAPNLDGTTVQPFGLSINNAEITGNTALYDGGGVMIFNIKDQIKDDSDNTLSEITVSISNSRIVGNSAEYGGGLAAEYANPTGDIQISDTIIANNTASESAADVLGYLTNVSLCSAETGEYYTAASPADLSGRKITNWYVDAESNRFADQEVSEREVVDNPNSLIDEDGYIYFELIAAPAVDSPYPTVSSSFVLTKDFVVAEGYDDAGNPIDAAWEKVIVDPEFVIEPYTSFNRQVGKTDIPKFAETSYTIQVSKGEKSLEIETPDFADYGIGDYWYKITEKDLSGIAGIGMDSVNPRYLHVQVVWKDETHTGMEARVVGLHASAPSEDGTYTNEVSDKASGFTNTYGAGSLSVEKKVSGNMADTGKLFKVTVTFTAPKGQTVMSDIAYKGGFADENGATALDDVITCNWTNIQTVTVYLKDGSAVSFTNIPEGVTYTVVEDDYAGDGYKVSYEIDSDDSGTDIADEGGVRGSVSDSSDAVTITNTKNGIIDVGVFLDNAPYVMIILIVVSAAVVMLVKRRKTSIDE